MPKLMERRDRVRVAADVGRASSVWSERIFGDAGESTITLPERGCYQVILLKINAEPRVEKPTCTSALDMIGHGATFHKLRTTEEWMRELQEAERNGIPPVKRLKIGSMKDEIHLPENFDQTFEALDAQVATMFAGVAS